MTRILFHASLMRRLEGYVTSLLVGPASQRTGTRRTGASPALRRTAPSHARVNTGVYRTLEHARCSHAEMTRLAHTLSIPTMVLRGSLDPLVTDGEARLAAEALAG